ncbi:hypothetical protein QQF64_025081 [Cirrhinus molitorella]|uniref:Uncharacterized protein n=1 Tax=Cirrhinus molitorella TaxID=172907 RepID=A0ABR3NP03_9TELE
MFVLYNCTQAVSLTCSMLQQSLFRLLFPLMAHYSSFQCNIPTAILTKIHKRPYIAGRLPEDEPPRCIPSPTACYPVKCLGVFLLSVSLSLSLSVWFCCDPLLQAMCYSKRQRVRAVAMISSSLLQRRIRDSLSLVCLLHTLHLAFMLPSQPSLFLSPLPSSPSLPPLVWILRERKGGVGHSGTM